MACSQNRRCHTSASPLELVLTRAPAHEFRLDRTPAPRIIRIAFRKCPKRMQVFRKNDDGIGLPGMFCLGLAKCLLQIIDVSDEGILAAVLQGDREEECASGNQCASIIHHGLANRPGLRCAASGQRGFTRSFRLHPAHDCRNLCTRRIPGLRCAASGLRGFTRSCPPHPAQDCRSVCTRRRSAGARCRWDRCAVWR